MVSWPRPPPFPRGRWPSVSMAVLLAVLCPGPSSQAGLVALGLVRWVLAAASCSGRCEHSLDVFSDVRLASPGRFPHQDRGTDL